MFWLGNLIDRLFTVGLVLAFMQTPFFLDQYSLNLAGHLAELEYQIDAMERVAKQTGKSLEGWIGKFVDSADPDFAAHGHHLQEMESRYQRLRSALSALDQASPFSRAFYFIRYFDSHIVADVASRFTFGVPFTIEGGLYGIFGAIVAAFISSSCKNLWTRRKKKVIPPVA